MISLTAKMLINKVLLMKGLEDALRPVTVWYASVIRNLNERERKKGLLFVNVAFDVLRGGIDVHTSLVNTNLDDIMEDSVFKSLPKQAFITLTTAYSEKYNGNKNVDPLILVVSSIEDILPRRWINYHMITPVILYAVLDEKEEILKYMFRIPSEGWLLRSDIRLT